MHNSHSLSDTNLQKQQFNHLHNHHQHHQHRKHPDKREMMETSSKSSSPSSSSSSSSSSPRSTSPRSASLPLHLLLLLILINPVDLPFPMFVQSNFIRIPKGEYLQPQGFDLELPCQMNSDRNELVECTWSSGGFEQHPLPGKYDFAKTNSNGDCSLTIRNLSFPENNGEWQCVILPRHRKTGQFCRTNVIVMITPSAPPQINKNIKEKEFLIFEKQTTNFICSSKGGNPPPSLEWFLNKKNISESARSISFPNLVESTLSYTFEKIHNASMLVCKSVHPMQSQDSFLLLNVLYRPTVSVSPRRYSKIEGEDLEVDCAVDSNPLAKIKWEHSSPKYFDGSFKSVGSKLIITVITHEFDRLIFYCSAVNYVGWAKPESVELNVLYHPILENVIGGRSEIVALGDEFHIECKFIGNPKPNVRWVFVDAIYNEEHTLTAGNNSGLLAIKSISYSNQGNYFCQGTNWFNGKSYETRSRPFHVNVFGKPQFWEPKINEVGFENKKIKIVQKFCCNPEPTKVLWIYDNSVQHSIDPRIYTQEVTDDSSHFDHECGLGSSDGTNGSHIMAGPLVSMHRNRMDKPICFRAALMLLNSTIADSRDYTLRVYNGGASKAEGVISLQIQSKHSDAI